MVGLADAVLPLIRTRGEVWRWSAANEHGVEAGAGVLQAEPEEPLRGAALRLAVLEQNRAGSGWMAINTATR